MGMLDNANWNGLHRRLTDHVMRSYPRVPQLHAMWIAMDIAGACYPNAKNATVISPSVVTAKEAREYTGDFVDRRSVSLDGLFVAVWGTPVSDFYDQRADAREKSGR